MGITAIACALIGSACTSRDAGPAADVHAQGAAAGGARSPASKPERRITPGTQRWVVLEAVDRDAPLFGDELDRVQAAALAAIDRTPGLRAVPKEEVARLRALAGAGRAREDGPVCAAAPTFAELLSRSYGEPVHARLALDCIGEHCFAGIDVAGELEVVVKVESAHDVAAWERALQGALLAPTKSSTLDPAPASDEAGPWVVAHVLAFGDFARIPQRAQLSTNELAACEGASRSSMLVSVSADGRAERCERLEGDVDSFCACTALSRHDFGAATGERRLTLQLTRTGAASALGSPRQPIFVSTDSGEPALRRAEHARALQPCITAATRKGKLEASLLLAESGAVQSAELGKDDLLTATERACVLDALGELKLTCPASVPARVRATVRIGP